MGIFPRKERTIFMATNFNAYNVKHFVIDKPNDLTTLPTDIEAGSTAFVIEASKTFMLSNDKQWREIGPEVNDFNADETRIINKVKVMIADYDRRNRYSYRNIKKINDYLYELYYDNFIQVVIIR